MQKTLERRLKLLELEGKGFTRPEIVKELSSAFCVSERTVHYDFECRAQWQVYRDDRLMLTILNRYEQIYRIASLHLYTAKHDNVKIGWARVMLDANKQIGDIYVIPSALHRLKQLRQQIGKGVYICPETLRASSKTSRRK